MKILIDADACPKGVLATSKRLAHKYQIPLLTVANKNHLLESEYHLVAEDEREATDIQLANEAQRGDIVVTHDLGLVAILLGKGVRCISLEGKEYQSKNLEFFLAERDLKSRFRRQGGRIRGPRKRKVQDDKRFARSLEEILRCQKS